MRSLSAKSVALVSILALLATILLPISVFLQHPDASLWLVAAILIAAIMAISIPLAAWLHRDPGWLLRHETRQPVSAIDLDTCRLDRNLAVTAASGKGVLSRLFTAGCPRRTLPEQ